MDKIWWQVFLLTVYMLCGICSVSVENFAFTLTDISGRFRFGFCHLSPGSQRCLCIVRSVTNVLLTLYYPLTVFVGHPVCKIFSSAIAKSSFGITWLQQTINNAARHIFSWLSVIFTLP